jgi:hypothetical protein
MGMADTTIREKGQRLPRFTRAGEDVLPFRIEARDVLGWRWLYDCRFLPADYLLLLLPGSEQQLTRRMQKWYHGAYVDRIRTGLTDWIYAIANKGADEVCVRWDRDRGRINWNKKNAELKDAYFRAHALSITRLRVALEMGLRHKAFPEAQAAVDRWPAEYRQAAMQEALMLLKRHNAAAPWAPDVFEAKARSVLMEHLVPDMLPPMRLRALTDLAPITPTVRLSEDGPTVPLSYTDATGKPRLIKPDWPFTLIDGHDELIFFHEADRSTTSLESVSGKRDMYMKYRAYWLLWRQEEIKARQGLPALKSFRVLTTTRSARRCENLRALARTVDDKQTGSAMFWFAEERAYDPHQPESIWQPIWKTPKDDRPHHLLE